MNIDCTLRDGGYAEMVKPKMNQPNANTPYCILLTVLVLLSANGLIAYNGWQFNKFSTPFLTLSAHPYPSVIPVIRF
jgi:hypothetical protein